MAVVAMVDRVASAISSALGGSGVPIGVDYRLAVAALGALGLVSVEVGGAPAVSVRAESSACVGCGREIVPGQLYVVDGPVHVGCREAAAAGEEFEARVALHRSADPECSLCEAGHVPVRWEPGF